MNVLIVVDSFKGTFSSARAAAFLKEGVLEAFPEASVRVIPVSDGGEGFLDALAFSGSFEKCVCPAYDALMRPVIRPFLTDGKGTACFETAVTCGLADLSGFERNPLKTTTFGLGMQIRKAAENNDTARFIVGLGGSGTHDCGMGALQALGVSFFDRSGRRIPDGAGGEMLEHINRAEFDGVPECIRNAKFVLATDVRNLLTGETGAARVFAPQKGADAQAVEKLEEGTRIFADVLSRSCGKDLFTIEGGGAAGGLAAGLSVFDGARIVSGADVVLESAGFEALLRLKPDGVITGEGRADAQTLFGKLPAKIAAAAKKYGVPVCLVCGTVGEGAENLLHCGVSKILPLFRKGLSLDLMKRETPEALKRAGKDACLLFLR